METFGIVCLLIVAAAIEGGLLWWVIASLMETEWAMAFVAAGCFLAMTGLLALIYSGVREDNRNPCVAWGPPRTTWMMVGKIMTPITTTPCIQRQNETEK